MINQKSKMFSFNINRIKVVALSLMALAVALVACKRTVVVKGTTTLSELEGRMLSLRVYDDGELTSIDSSRVVHGQFQFAVPEDSVVMASLFIGDESVMPVVLDGQPVEIIISEADRKVTGSALNDSLYAFIKGKRAIDEQLAALPHKESQMIMDGMDHDAIIAQLNSEAAVLGAQNDALVTAFIKRHMDDVLGPGVFMIATSSFPYPYMTPQVEEIITFASESFKSNAYVRDFVRIARENEEKMHE